MAQQKNPIIRIITAASLFDGHDVAINIMRRVMQSQGAEVIHLGHDRSVQEVVRCAIQEDAHAIAISSYQGGHNEYFRYMYDLLREQKAGHIKIFGGGGGVILSEEIKALETYGIEKIYSPEDGRKMGIAGMIADMLQRIDPYLDCDSERKDLRLPTNYRELTRGITCIELEKIDASVFDKTEEHSLSEKTPPVLGITGTGGSGKSTLIDEWVRRFLTAYPDQSICILSMDPSRKKSGGALLGDRIRMNAIDDPRVFMRSMATRSGHSSITQFLEPILALCKQASFDVIILETSGIGQSDSVIAEYADLSLYVMTPEFGAPTQLEKIDMLDFADIIALNKADKPGADDALRWIRKQYQRNHLLWDTPEEELPVYATQAAQFNDPGMNALFRAVITRLAEQWGEKFSPGETIALAEEVPIKLIPSNRVRYLSEISETIKEYDQHAARQADVASQWYVLAQSRKYLEPESETNATIEKMAVLARDQLTEGNRKKIEAWTDEKSKYQNDEYSFRVRGKEIRIKNYERSLSGLDIPKIAVPKFRDWGDLLHWQLQENFPGFFPYAAGIYPFKREGEDPTRMFAGEGSPERTNKRFHYVSRGMEAKRLSTAFDSVTLYGHDPDERPDIYGKTGNAGVSICTVDDAKKLYSGFDLAHPGTSVSMTINGPAPTITAFFLHAAIDQQCEKYISQNGLEEKVEKYKTEKYGELNLAPPEYAGPLPEGNDGLGLMLLGLSGKEVLPEDVYEKIRAETLHKVRGTVQADILKEDQAQNTCIFSTAFSLKVMGDMQIYFTRHLIQNFYSVSISGYHIAEAGANPVTQLAFTLANGFTYVEYYLSRGLDIDDFAPNLSFFFSNGVDAEYSVIGRVARKIWAKAIRDKYDGNTRSQKLKYHIQTSGRSLHSQEIAYNDIRTTLQALYAIYDNCNSLHTNAYDEAVTTPTEESVRRALAIQLIINKELGLAKNENPLQGSFIIRELTELVEEAVLAEFERLTTRGGVLGAMETMYQRSMIQEQSMYYEQKKHDGSYPIIGVNTFLQEDSHIETRSDAVIRSSQEEKDRQISNLRDFKKRNETVRDEKLGILQKRAAENENVFETLMGIAPFCSLGEITNALFEVGGQYRRGM